MNQGVETKDAGAPVRLCVPTTFEIGFLDRLNEINQKCLNQGSKVYEVYGSFRRSVLGTGRESTVLPNVDADYFRKYVERAHSHGIQFNYTLNASCTDNLEFTEKGHREIENLLTTLSKAHVDSITVATPYLIEHISENYPEFKVIASSICYIDSLERALTYEKLGADRIVLVPDLNRNFALLKLIRSKVRADLEVIANNACLLKCPYRYYHNNVTAHVSQKIAEDPTGFSYIQYSMMRCVLDKLANPREILRAPWFPPKSVKYYVELGVDFVKLGGRGATSSQLLEIVEAYLSGIYEGDVHKFTGNAWKYFQKNRIQKNDETILKPLEITIDGDALDEFLTFFRRNNPPCDRGCSNCNYCEVMAKRIVKFSSNVEDIETVKQEYIKRIKGMIRGITSKERLPIEFYEKDASSWAVRKVDTPLENACGLESN